MTTMKFPIEKLASEFRTAIEMAKKEGEFEADFIFSRFPRGCCGDVSSLLGQYLLENNINYDKQDNISDTTKYEDHFVAENRLIAISKSGRSMDSEDVQNFLKATERGIDVQLFVRKNKDDKISKEFYYLGRVIATGNAKQFVMPNTDKTAVEIEWELETPVREDIYQYIVNE